MVKSISETLAGQCILITGVTGSVGSVLLEKILRCCPEVNKIFVLIREFPGTTSYDKFDKLIKMPLFSKIDPICMKKVQVITGNVTSPNLGLNIKDYEILVENVTLVFHSAARVAFNMNLKSAVNANLIGTKRVLQLCQDIKKLEGLIYVSTAYSNCTSKEVSERLYPISHDPEQVITLVETLSDKQLDILTPKLLGQHPNTYTFSKQLAEHLLASQRGDIKVAIVRPSIVLATWREPFPGWIVVNQGAAGVMAGASKGVFRTLLSNKAKVADFIPSDVVVNFLLAAAWSLLQPDSLSLQIYHVTSGSINPITWLQYSHYLLNAYKQYPGKLSLWYPGFTCCNQLWRSQLTSVLYQLWPSYIVDFIEDLTKKKHNKYKTESLANIQKKFIRGMSHTHYFSKQQWKFYTDNAENLTKRLVYEDKDTFNMKIGEINWNNYLEDNVLGIRKFYFRDPIETLPKAKRNLKILQFIHYFMMLLFICTMTYMTSLVFSDPVTFTFAASLLLAIFLWL